MGSGRSLRASQMPRGPSRAAHRDTLDRPASPLRRPPSAPYLDFSIGDGCQIFGVPGDGYGLDAVAFWAAVKYCVHRNTAKQDQGTPLCGDLPCSPEGLASKAKEEPNVVHPYNGLQCSCTKEGSTDPCCIRGGPQKHHVK